MNKKFLNIGELGYGGQVCIDLSTEQIWRFFWGTRTEKAKATLMNSNISSFVLFMGLWEDLSAKIEDISNIERVHSPGFLTD